MAKVWTNSRWTLKWKGVQTGYWYKLVITPSDNIDITAVDIDLPQDCLLEFEYSWEYDTYPIGMYACPTLDLTFAIDLCPSDFVKALYDPFTDIIMTELNAYIQTQDDITLTTGNLFELYIAYDGFDLATSYKAVFIGVQQSGKEFEYTEGDKSCKIEVVDISYYCLSNLPTKYLCEFLPDSYSEVEILVGYSDWKYTLTNPTINVISGSSCFAGGAVVMAGQPPPPLPAYRFWFFPVYRIFWIMNVIFLYYGWKLRRHANTGYFNLIFNPDNLKYLLGNYYKQQNNGGGGIGAQLGYSEIYGLLMASKETVDSNWADALLNNNEGDMGLLYILNKEYPTCWDFIKDFTAEHLRRGYIQIDNSSAPGYAVFTTESIYAANYIDITDISLRDVSLESYEVLQEAEAIAIDKVEETVDKIVATNTKTKNDVSFTINSLLQTVPFAGKMEGTPGSNWIGVMSAKVNNTILLYKDDDGSMRRVNERCIIPISASETTNDIVTIPNFDLTSRVYNPNGIGFAPNYDPQTPDGGTGNICRQTVAQFSGKLRILAESLLQIFSHKHQSKLTGKCWLNELATSATTNNVFAPTHELVYDLSNIEVFPGMFSQISNRFMLLSVTLYKDESVNFEAITRRADSL